MTRRRQEGEKHAADDEDASRLPSSCLCHSDTYSEPASVHRHDNGHAAKEPGEVGLMAHGGRGSIERDAEQEEDAVDRPATDLVAQGRPEEPEQAGEKEREKRRVRISGTGRHRAGRGEGCAAHRPPMLKRLKRPTMPPASSAVMRPWNMSCTHPVSKPGRSMRSSTRSAQQHGKHPVYHPALHRSGKL